jgi:hypothetical protein
VDRHPAIYLVRVRSAGSDALREGLADRVASGGVHFATIRYRSVTLMSPESPLASNLTSIAPDLGRLFGDSELVSRLSRAGREIFRRDPLLDGD